MTKYKDRLTDDYDLQIGSVIGCELDRLNGHFSHDEITYAVDCSKKNESMLNLLLGITQNNLHHRIDFGFPVGKELI